MSVDTKGVVVTTCKDVLLAAGLVDNSLKRLIQSEMRLAGRAFRELDLTQRAAQFDLPTLQLMPEQGMVSIHFTFKGDVRRLLMFFTCDSDNLALGPKSISLMMGCHGDNVLLMKTALHALSILGPAYFDENDCDSIPLAPLGEYTPNVLQALRLGYWSSYYLQDFTQRFDAGVFPAASFEEFFGAPETWVRSQVDENRDVNHSKEQVMEAAFAQPLPPLGFMTQFHRSQAAA
jgi:hypothetical protein